MAKLQDVNTTDIRDAVALGCRTMCSVFDADDDDIPFFGSSVLPDAELRFSAAHSEAHVPGRHLNALLNAEAAAGITIDEDAIDKHTRAAFFSFSGPIALPLNRTAVDGPLVNFLPHNIREGLHALYALVRFRQSERAQQLAQDALAAMLANWDTTDGWNTGVLSTQLGLAINDATFISGIARAIGPLTKYYRATGYPEALQLATLLQEKAVAECFAADGHYDRQRHGTHTHSTTCVMSSLAQLADLTRNAALLARIKAFYDNGLQQIRDGLGWVIENSGDDAPPDRGEVNNTGDLVETALILGKWGHPSYFQDAERMVRGHLLPSQLRDVSFITEPPNPEGRDCLRAVAARHHGAFGFPAPYGHAPLGVEQVSFNMDIVGGAVGSLCEVLRSIAVSGVDGHRINLFFDHETDALRIESPYTHGTHDALGVWVKRPGPLHVRIPDWADGEQVRVRGTEQRPVVANGYLLLSRPPLNRRLVFELPLAERTITLQHRTRGIEVRLRGDQVVAMQDVGADLTYFDPL